MPVVKTQSFNRARKLSASGDGSRRPVSAART